MFQAAQTSERATWFAHLDVVSLRTSEIGKQLIAELGGDSQRQLRQFERMLNFHPIDDLDSVTVYGTSNDPEKAVALISGTFDTERLTGIAEDGDGYTPFDHGRTTIHSWKDGGRRIYGAISSEKLVMISPEIDLVRMALDVTTGVGNGLSEENLFGHVTPDQAPIIIASANLSDLGSLNIDSALVRKVESIYVSAGEHGGELHAYAALKTADQRSAKLVDQMLHGVLALAEASGEIPQDIIDGFKTELGDGDDHGSISLTVSLPVRKFKSLVAKIEKAAEGLQ